MGSNLSRTLVRASVFLVVCVLFMFAIFAVFGQLRFDSTAEYGAEFSNVSGLETGQFVRIAGVEVGKVDDIDLHRDGTLRVTFSTDQSVVLTHGTRAVIRYDDLIGGRYLALEEGTGDVAPLRAGDTISIDNTSPALDMDALIGGFRPLFRALKPDEVNALSAQLVSVFEGQGDTLNSFFDQLAALTGTLGQRDQLIGDVVKNLSTVLGAIGDKDTRFAEAVDSLSQLMETLASRRDQVGEAVTNANGVAATLTDLLDHSRRDIRKVVQETDRTAGIIVADHDYVDNLLNTLPDSYKILNRQALHGDYFGFYLCDVAFKFNGKGGQPVYARVFNQASGRCAPK